MFRLLLTAYVTSMLLAGPSVCCCTLASVISGSIANDGAAHAVRVPACCSQHARTTGAIGKKTVGSAKEQSCPAGPEEQQECPCRSIKSQVIAEDRKPVSEIQQLRGLVPSPFDLLTIGATIGDTTALPNCRAQIENRSSHFGSSHEILRSLQIFLI